VRLASGAGQLITNAIDALRSSHGADVLLFSSAGDTESESLIAALGLAPSRVGKLEGMPLTPSFPDIVAGAQFTENTLSDNAVALTRAAVVRLLQKAISKLSALASALPALEEASSVMKITQISMDIPSLLEPRVLSVADESPVAIGISTVDVDDKGRPRDSLLPFMAAPFNYTAFALQQATKGPAMRLASAEKHRFTLPDDLSAFVVPISFLEGERALPMLPTLSTLPGADRGIDFLRSLRAYLSSDPRSIPCTLAQVAANFIILVKPGLVRDVDSAFVELFPLKNSLADLAGYSALLPTDQSVLTYGVPTRTLIEENIKAIDELWYTKALLHPDPRMDVALLPLFKIPDLRRAAIAHKYARYSAGHLTPIPFIASAQIPWIPAAFSQRPAVNHQFFWSAVVRMAPPRVSAYLSGPTRVSLVAHAAVGYLDDEVLSASSSPWKKHEALAAPDTIVLIPDAPLAEQIPAAATENIEPERI
jgi:hypothetical protein